MIEQSGNGLRISGPMLIANANALLEAGRAFLRSCAGTEEVVFDLFAVKGTDSSSLSVIFGWLRTAREQGVTLRITRPAPSMISQATLYGVVDSLPLA